MALRENSGVSTIFGVSKIIYFSGLVIIETCAANRCRAASGLRDCSQGSLSWMNEKQMNKGEILLTKRRNNRSKI
jgi:hypothetical protein